LVEPNDTTGLSKALITLLKDPALGIQMGQKAKRSVGKDFTWPRIVDKLEAVYAEVLSKGK